MKPLQQASIPQSEVEKTIRLTVGAWKNGDPALRKLFSDAANAEKAIEQTIRQVHTDDCREVWKNDQYQVLVRRVNPQMVHLSIKRIDKQPVRSWRDFQEIKNQLVGEECEAVEIYPAESRKVDAANQYHLWCFTDPTYRVPFGYFDGRVVSDTKVADSVNLPLSEMDKQRNKANGCAI